MDKNLEQRLKQIEDNAQEHLKETQNIKLTTSHTKRTSVQNGKKIEAFSKEGAKRYESIKDEMQGINKSMTLILADLTGEKGYFKQIDKNSADIEINHNNIDINRIGLSKTDTKIIRIIVFSITAGLIMGWLIREARIQERTSKATILTHKEYKYIKPEEKTL